LSKNQNAYVNEVSAVKIIDRYLPHFNMIVKRYMNSVTSFSPKQLSILSTFMDIMRNIANHLQYEEDLSIQLVNSMMEDILTLLKKLNKYLEKSTLNSVSEKYYDLQRTCSYAVSSMCISGEKCQKLLFAHNGIEILYPLINSANEKVTQAGWYSLNWAITSCDEAKFAFIRLGGASRIEEELRKEKIFSRNVVYCTRKLAMLPDSRRQLISCGVIHALINLNKKALEYKEAKPLFVSSLALAFFVIEDDKTYREMLDETDIDDTLFQSVEILYNVTTRNSLSVLYTQLDDALTLIKSENYSAKCFGVWWILHLLWGENLKFYTRGYTELAIRDNIIPAIFDCLNQEYKSEFLHQLCLECIYVASLKSFSKPLLVEQGLWRVLERITQFTNVNSAIYLLFHIVSDKDHYKYPVVTGPTSRLTHITTNYICDNTDIEDQVQFLNLTSSTSLYRLSMYFLTSVVHLNSNSETPNTLKLDELSDGVKTLVHKLSEIYNTNKKQIPLLYSGRHETKELVSTSDLFKNF